VYTYGAKLEVASPRFSQRADFFVYICSACLVILVSCVHITIAILFFSVGIEVHLCGIILELRNRLLNLFQSLHLQPPKGLRSINSTQFIWLLLTYLSPALKPILLPGWNPSNQAAEPKYRDQRPGPRALAFITTSTISSWNLPVSLLGLATFPSQYLPYAFLLLTLLIRGPIAAAPASSQPTCTTC
jgi:hypothetical protein